MVQGASFPRPVLLTLAVVFAAATVFYSAIWMYTVRWQPEARIGITLPSPPPQTGPFAIDGMEEGGPAQQAGFGVGDRVVAVNGRALDSPFEFIDAVYHGRPGDIVSVTVERPGEPAPLTFDATLGPALPGEALPPARAILDQVTRSFPVLFVIVGLGVLFLRLEDRNAWLLALLFGSWVAAPPLLNVEAGIPPALRGFEVAYKVTALGLFGPLFYYFFAVFPASSPIDRRLPWLKQMLLGLAVAVSVPLGLWALVAGSFQPVVELGARVADAGLNGLNFWFTIGTFGLGLVSLVWNARATSADARRKTRVIVFGTVVGAGPVLVLLTVGFLNELAFEEFPYWIATVCTLAVFLVPLSFAYAVARHRVLGVPQLLRLALQYAFARTLLLSLVPLLAGLLLLDLLLHADQPLIDVLRARGWVYGVLGGLALVTQTQRQRWLGTLDRTFFRERYDARRLLGEVVMEVSEAASFEQVAPRAVARIEAALHAEFVAVSMLTPNETSFRSIASAPAGRAPLALAVDSKVVTLLQVLGKPLEVSLSGTSWLTQQLPHEETDYLRQSRIDLLVPIAGGPGRTQALLALGPKRSEEPYTGEDQELLVLIATSLALLLDRPVAAAPAPRTDAFEECPQCGACYDTGLSQCAEDGARLSRVNVSRVLSERYRLDRRLGRGGMGTVYVATDAALERRVAVKVIRDDLVGSVDAADRFRREARATAAFSHPNVVTVHDFGVDRDTRAFLVMELLEGTNLRDELTRQTRLPADPSVRILGSVCAAVEAAHARDLVHRDLKPENIFLARSPTGEVTKVLDFGIAKFVSATSASEAATAEGTVLGTVRYMSPEQLRGGTVQPAWDLWALTVMAYEMLTGAHPFAGATIDETHQAILGARSAPVATHLPDAPSGAQAFFARAFVSDPAERPPSARALRADLERAFA